MTTLNPTLARVLKRLHYPLDVILTCVRWYVAYPLSLRSDIWKWMKRIVRPANVARPYGGEVA